LGKSDKQKIANLSKKQRKLREENRDLKKTIFAISLLTISLTAVVLSLFYFDIFQITPKENKAIIRVFYRDGSECTNYEASVFACDSELKKNDFSAYVEIDYSVDGIELRDDWYYLVRISAPDPNGNLDIFPHIWLEPEIGINDVVLPVFVSKTRVEWLEYFYNSTYELGTIAVLPYEEFDQLNRTLTFLPEKIGRWNDPFDELTLVMKMHNPWQSYTEENGGFFDNDYKFYAGDCYLKIEKDLTSAYTFYDYWENRSLGFYPWQNELGYADWNNISEFYDL